MNEAEKRRKQMEGDRQASLAFKTGLQEALAAGNQKVLVTQITRMVDMQSPIPPTSSSTLNSPAPFDINDEVIARVSNLETFLSTVKADVGEMKAGLAELLLLARK